MRFTGHEHRQQSTANDVSVKKKSLLVIQRIQIWRATQQEEKQKFKLLVFDKMVKNSFCAKDTDVLNAVSY